MVLIFFCDGGAGSGVKPEDFDILTRASQKTSWICGRYVTSQKNGETLPTHSLRGEGNEQCWY
jgi:hypothetical protein